MDNFVSVSSLSKLPSIWPVRLQPTINQLVINTLHENKLVVVDDDPTGSQLVYKIPILTEWELSILVEELENSFPAFFIITNTRGMPPARAKEINEEIGRCLHYASKIANKRVSLISRGDSTLRGYFPLEVEALSRGFGQTINATFLIPALIEGGRCTYNDIHYVRIDNYLVPVGETEYAKDATFGYSSSNLREWIEEKSRGNINAKDVASISIECIRNGPDKVHEQILSLPQNSYCVVNVLDRRDLEVFTLALLSAERKGKNYICRTGPSFVPVRIGIEGYSFLTRGKLPQLDAGVGGLTIVGSYVSNTTKQVNEVIHKNLVISYPISIQKILDETCRQDTIRNLANTVNQNIKKGQDVMIYTSRKLVTGDSPAQSLAIGQRVSGSLIGILKNLSVRPKYIIAKGGVTASDIVKIGLGVKRALVLGQLDNGISVWKLGPESRWPGLPYVVFPGNVGAPDTLSKIINIFKG